MTSSVRFAPPIVFQAKPRKRAFRAKPVECPPNTSEEPFCAGSCAPSHPHGQSHGMSPIGHIAQEAGPTKEKPNEHRPHGDVLEIKPGGGIEVAAHPNVTKQPVKHP